MSATDTAERLVLGTTCRGGKLNGMYLNLCKKLGEKKLIREVDNVNGGLQSAGIANEFEAKHRSSGDRLHIESPSPIVTRLNLLVVVFISSFINQSNK